MAIALMVALIFFSVSRMKTIYGVVERVVGVQHPAIESLYIMHGAARDRSLLLHDIVNTDDPFDKEERIQQFTELGVVFGNARQKFMALNLTGNRLALIEAQRQHTERAVPLQWRVIDLAKAPDKPAANQLLVEAAIPAQNRVIADLKELLDLELAESVQLSEAADAQLQQAYRLMAIGGAGAVFLTMLVMAIVNRRMSTLVSRLVDAVGKLRMALKDVEYEKLALDKHAIVSITDASGRITYVNDKFIKTCGYSRDELMGQNHRLLKTDHHPPAFFQDMWATIARGGVWQGEVCNRASDGRACWMATTIVPFLDDTGSPYQHVAIRTDITDIKEAEKILMRDKQELGELVHERTSELALANKALLAEVARRQELEEELRKLASIDKLTGIFNRRVFDDAIKKEMERAKRYLHPMSLILFDIDHFKQINDTHGHPVGDQILKELARIVSARIRIHDVFARWGGEEFIILGVNSDTEACSRLAEKLRILIESHDFPSIGKLTCSFGVASLHSDDSVDSIVKRADEALYNAKHGGRNRIATLS